MLCKCAVHGGGRNSDDIDHVSNDEHIESYL